MDRREIGQAAEEAAAGFLAAQGYAVLLRNFRRRLGELDIVARSGDILIVAEVRTRATDVFGGAPASVGWRKQRRLKRAAAQLLQTRKDLLPLRVRFDVLVVYEPCGLSPRVEWIRHAFV